MKRVTKGHVTLKWYVLRFCVRSLMSKSRDCGIGRYFDEVCANIARSWDLGGQPRFRSMWERYCRGVNAMV